MRVWSVNNISKYIRSNEMLFRVADISLYAGSLSVREVGGLKTDQLTQSAKMALVIPDKFQHILRVMNTNIHGRKNYCPGI